MATSDDRWFLIVRDRYAGETRLKQFDDDDEAWAAYLNAEDEYRDRAWGADPQIEVVLIGAEDEAGVRQSYSHYFEPGSRHDRQVRILDRLMADLGLDQVKSARHSFG